MEPQGKGSVLNAVKTRGKGSASRFPTRRPDPGVRVDHIDRAYAGANAAQPAAALPLLHPPREYQAETGAHRQNGSQNLTPSDSDDYYI